MSAGPLTFDRLPIGAAFTFPYGTATPDKRYRKTGPLDYRETDGAQWHYGTLPPVDPGRVVIAPVE